jgi:hypothetical protein
VSNRFISFAGSTVEIQAQHDACEWLLDFLLMTIKVEQIGQPHIIFTLDWLESRNEFVLGIPGTRAYLSQSPALMGTYLMDRLGYHLADRSQGGLLLHAACVAYQDKGVLLVGGTGVGKSSLTTHLLLEGWDYLTDELSFLLVGGLTCQGFARPIQLKKSSVKLFSEALLSAENSGQLLASVFGCLLQPQGVGSNALSQVEIGCILLPRYQPQNELAITRHTKAQAGFELMQCLINARNLPRHGFSKIVRLASSIPVYRLIYSNFNQISDILKTIISV